MQFCEINFNGDYDKPYIWTFKQIGINQRLSDNEKQLQEELLKAHSDVMSLQQQIMSLKVKVGQFDADKVNYEEKINRWVI